MDFIKYPIEPTSEMVKNNLIIVVGVILKNGFEIIVQNIEIRKIH